MKITLEEKRKTIAIVDYWPGIENAEAEVILRFKMALDDLNYDTLFISRHGFLVDDVTTHIDETNAVFVLALHFDTAKCWDKFTYFAIWNPVDFYFQWSYRLKSNNLLSHDGFLSCGANVVDDHIRRLLTGAGRKVEKTFKTLYHGVAGPIYNPSLGRERLFYCGINWEAVSGKPGRHHDLLKVLDKKGVLDIYGPDVFLGVKVWNGYESYQGPIPFDGKSLIGKVARSGIGLVLSSPDHIKSEMMSNRLFECLAAGVPIICDNNPFAKKFFSDMLYFIDTEKTAEIVAMQIFDHIQWIKDNKDIALEKALRAQTLYLEKFHLQPNLLKIINSQEHSLKTLNHASGGRIFYSVFISDENDKSLKSKLMAHSGISDRAGKIIPIAIVPSTLSAIRITELKEVAPECIILYYNVTKKDPKTTQYAMMDEICRTLEIPSVNDFIQYVMPWETPVWNGVIEAVSVLDHNKSINMYCGGFTVMERIGDLQNGSAAFYPEPPYGELLNAASPFCAASQVYRAGRELISCVPLIRYSPYLWGRFLYACYIKNGHNMMIGKVLAKTDYDVYAILYRPVEVQDVMREVEFMSDFLGEVYVKRDIMSHGYVPHPMVITSEEILNKIEGPYARKLLGKLLLQIKAPKIITLIFKFLWEKGRI